MSDSDLNEKFKEYYAENGIDADSVAAFDMSKLDYIHWGHHAVAFPSFFEVTLLDSLEAWVYSGYHGNDGVRIVKHKLNGINNKTYMFYKFVAWCIELK